MPTLRQNIASVELNGPFPLCVQSNIPVAVAAMHHDLMNKNSKNSQGSGLISVLSQLRAYCRSYLSHSLPDFFPRFLAAFINVWVTQVQWTE